MSCSIVVGQCLILGRSLKTVPYWLCLRPETWPRLMHLSVCYVCDTNLKLTQLFRNAQQAHAQCAHRFKAPMHYRPWSTSRLSRATRQDVINDTRFHWSVFIIIDTVGNLIVDRGLIRHFRATVGQNIQLLWDRETDSVGQSLWVWLAQVGFLSDTTYCPMMMSRSVCRTRVPDSGSKL